MAVDVPRLVFLIFILLFLFFNPDSRTASPSQRQELADQIGFEKYALRQLNESNYGTFDPASDHWLNLTGLRRNDNYAWDLLSQVQDEAREQMRVALEDYFFSSVASNLTRPENESWSRQERSNLFAQDALRSMQPFQEPAPFFQNVTGILRGQWSRSSLHSALATRKLNLTQIAPDHFYPSQTYKRNITSLSGDLRIKFEEPSGQELPARSGLVRDIKAELQITDETSSGDGWDVVLFGVHYLRQGGLLLCTTSEKFAGIFTLPHFALSQQAFALTQQSLNQSLQSTITDQETSFDRALNPWSSSPSNPSDLLFSLAQCEYIVYLQQHPISSELGSLEDMEQELRHPSGTAFRSIPNLKMSALIFSPDCGFVLESKGPPRFAPQEGLHLNGVKLELYLRSAKRWILTFAALVAAQIFLLKRQMHDTSTPSTRSRVSFYTVSIMALGDGFVFISLWVAGMFIDALFLPLVSTAFLAFVCASLFGMKFLMDVWTVQAPERQERQRGQQRQQGRRADPSTGAPNEASADTTASTNAPNPPIITAAAAVTLPLPVTAPRPNDTGTANPIILPPDQDLDAAQVDDTVNTGANQTTTNQNTTAGNARRELGALYTKFYFLLLAILFLSLHATSWPLLLRSIYCNLLAFTYLSFWIPQIYRNVIRNCRKALRWEFVIGESLLRLAPFAYFYGVEENFLFVSNDVNALLVLAGWLWIQVWALVSQEILGPRFFVPDGWAPPAYDYHPILREGDGSDGGESGALLPLGFTESLNATSSLSTPDPPPSSSSAVTGAEASAPTAAAGESASTSNPTAPKKKKDGKRIFDCAICTEDIEVPVVPAGGGGGGSIPETAPSTSASSATAAATATAAAAALSTTLFSRRAYMVTPCRHIFHSACLEGWMRYRLQCPICRESLPPL